MSNQRRKDDVMSVVNWVEDMLEINGIERHWTFGYDTVEFELLGRRMVITVRTRRP